MRLNVRVCLCVVTSQVLCVSSVDTEGAVSVSAKISDFGLALRAMPLPNGRGWASVSTPPRGTPLYMAPELLKETDARGCVQVWSAAGFFCAHLSGMYVHHPAHLRASPHLPLSSTPSFSGALHRFHKCRMCTALVFYWRFCSLENTVLPCHPMCRCVRCRQ